jgi:hypothetical protein
MLENRVVAIHQPNYLPWLGYFFKIIKSDVFVFLDDAQYSKNSYINRVQFFGKDEKSRWLTIPVSSHLGQSINEVSPSINDWKSRHVDTLYGLYSKSENFLNVWSDIQEMYDMIDPLDSISQINSILVMKISKMLGIETSFQYSSSLRTRGKGEERLISIVSSVAPSGSYLSGQGGRNYQNPESFINANLSLEYTEFSHPKYQQWSPHFQEGLSILDLIFHLGWNGAAAVLNIKCNE